MVKRALIESRIQGKADIHNTAKMTRGVARGQFAHIKISTKIQAALQFAKMFAQGICYKTTM
jgi:hypothetical protein